MTNQDEQRNPIEVLAEDFIRQRRQGNEQTVDEYASSHPELADDIRQMFPAIVAMEQVKAGMIESGDRPLELRVDKLKQLGDYRILREIGRGSMGIVYEAEQQSLGRLVAVKVFPQQVIGDSRRLQRFRREARVAALLHHTNIVQVIGVGEQDGLSYYVMQLIRGVSLDRVIDQLRNPMTGEPVTDAAETETDEPTHSSVLFSAAAAAHAVLGRGFEAWSAPEGESTCAASLCPVQQPPGTDRDDSWQLVPIEDGDVPQHVSFTQGPPVDTLPHSRSYWHSIAQIGIQVGEGLRYAHSHGTLHRDIKPSNLLLDPKGTVWITDFGVAKAVSHEQISQPGDIVGTLRYMPPEQLGGDCDARSDLYSLGLTLYELITLCPPFSDTSEDGLIRRKLNGDPTPLRKLQPRVPRDLETIVHKAIARVPDRRYQTADEFVDDLTRFIDGRPIRARRVYLTERLWRWSRRNPAIASLSTALLLVVLGSLGVVSREWRETEFEKKRVVEENHRAEANLSLALDSMGQLLDRFEANWMSHPRAPESDRDDIDYHVAVTGKSARILEDALFFYDQFAARNAGNPRLQRDTANAHRRVGEIHLRLGEYDKAETAFCRAIAIYDSLSHDRPDGSAAARLKASTLNRLGRVEWLLGRLGDARIHFDEAKQILACDVDDFPALRYELACTNSNLGSVLWPLREPAEARRSDARAIQLLEQIAAEEPNRAEYRLALARVYSRHYPTGDERAKGRKRRWFREEAVSLIEELVAEYPGIPDYQCELSETLMTVSSEPIGGNARAGGLWNHQAPETQLVRATNLAKTIADEYPEIPRYRGALARSWKDLGWLKHETNRPHEAEPLIAKAVVLYEDLAREFEVLKAYQFFLAMALQSHGEVLREIDRLVESRDSIQRAIDQQEMYLKATPDTFFGKSVLARQKQSLSETLTLLGESDEAAEATRQAEEIRESMKQSSM
jgi:eukaryotic-like serine/threonine-protein kinase